LSACRQAFSQVSLQQTPSTSSSSSHTQFRPMKYTLSGRDEKTLMKLIVHKETDRVIGCHM